MKQNWPYLEDESENQKLIRSRATCTCQIKLQKALTLHYINFST